jgi:Anti-sigma-K factor rskA/Putative zinc-finger
MMSTNFSHQDIVELLGAFALDAVDDDERDVIEAHLAGCPRCRAEVEGHRETAALLAHSGERAPENVWDRIAEALDEAPPALDLTRLTPRRPAVPRTIPLRMAAVTMAVAAAVTLFLGVALGRNDDGRLGRLEEQITALQKPAVANAAYAALADPKAEHVELASVDGKDTARVVRLPDGTGYLVPANLPKLPAGRVYQLWAVRSDAKISLGVLGAAPEVTAFRMNGPVAAYAVTDEAAGGVAQSQNQPVVVGYVKA